MADLFVALLILVGMGILIVRILLWQKKSAAIERRERELARAVLDPRRFVFDEPILPLPKFSPVVMRPELSTKFCEQARGLFGEACFRTENPAFLRVVVYFLAGLERTFQGRGFSFVDWGDLPVDLPESVWGRVAESMANHMRLSCAGFEVEFGPVDEKTAGRISWPEDDDAPAKIELATELASHFAAAVKVLSHELSHQVMYKMGFHHPEVLYNERLTDLMSLYVGFFKYIVEGITYVKHYDSAFSWETSTTGYLSLYEMCYLYRLVSAVHGELEHCEEGLTRGGRLELSRSRWIKGLTAMPMAESEIKGLFSAIKVLKDEFEWQKTKLNAVSPTEGCLLAVKDLLTADEVLLLALEQECLTAHGTVRRALSVLWSDDLRLLQIRSQIRRRLLDMDAALRPKATWREFDIAESVIVQEINEGVMSAPERFAALIAAAEAGDVEAQFSLALRYDNGTGCEKSEERAVLWYRRAAENGSVLAQNNLSVILLRGNNHKEGVKWLRTAAEGESAVAQLNLAHCLMNGAGVSENHAEAAIWYLRAAENGVSGGQLAYGYCCLNGDGRPEDAAEAVEWFRRAADQGDPTAMNQLGVCCRDGVGVLKDWDAALDWFRQAAGMRHPDGLFNLGECHWFGRGVPVNRDEAKLWYQDAVNAGSEAAALKLAEQCR